VPGRLSGFPGKQGDNGNVPLNNRISGVGALVNAEIDRSEPVGTSQANFIVALGVDNIEAAQEALSEQITSWNYP